jgi:hypothetical protein
MGRPTDGLRGGMGRFPQVNVFNGHFLEDSVEKPGIDRENFLCGRLDPASRRKWAFVENRR